MPSEQNWDIVVIGAGSCGLTAAAYLAKAGKRCLVLEMQHYAGGGVASLQMAEPGHLSERHAPIHRMIMASPPITHDELGLLSEYGLNYLPLSPAYAIIVEDGVLPLYRDRQKNIDTLKALTPEDVEVYQKFAETALQITKLLLPGMYETPPDNSAKIAESAAAEDIAFPSQASSLDVINKYFKNEMLRDALLRYTAELQLARPMSEDTSLMVYLGVGVLKWLWSLGSRRRWLCLHKRRGEKHRGAWWRGPSQHPSRSDCS
jgi:phytoene dehydrogenase-like protein